MVAERTALPLDVEGFRRKFGCEIDSLPRNVVLAGWSEADDRWHCGPATSYATASFDRVPPAIGFVNDHVRPRLAGGSFWFMLCFWDGWRERHPFSDRYAFVPAGDLTDCTEWRGAPGELPLLSPGRRWIACFGAHCGDPSAVLLPEAHYLARGGYREMFAQLRREEVSWDAKSARAVLCAGDHGEPANFFPPPVPGRPHPRRHLAAIVKAAGLDVGVHLGKGVPRALQMSCKWILDVDGFTRTWDAFAWKMRSGSVVLSPASPWESFFTRQFEPWAHFVPLANDFADLAEKLDWCRANDDECRQIAERARQRSDWVYRPENVARIVARQWRTLLA